MSKFKHSMRTIGKYRLYVSMMHRTASSCRAKECYASQLHLEHIQSAVRFTNMLC